MGKIIDLNRNQRKKLHLMSLDSGEKVLTSWIDNNTAQNLLKLEGAVVYRLPSGQLFADIALTDKQLTNHNITAGMQRRSSISIGDISKSTVTNIPSKPVSRKKDIDIADLI